MSLPLVIDTNVWLDAWVFDNPSWRPIGDALRTGAAHAHLTPAMHAEVCWVLDRPMPERFEARRQAVLATVAAGQWPEPGLVLCQAPQAESLPRLRCKDHSDQMFIDLALALSGSAVAGLGNSLVRLISRDQALLKLAGKARLHGVQVMRPEGWTVD